MGEEIIAVIIVLTFFSILAVLFISLFILVIFYLNSAKKLLSYLRNKHPDQLDKLDKVIIRYWLFKIIILLHPQIFFKFLKFLKEVDTRNDPELFKMKSRILKLSRITFILFGIFIVMFFIVFALICLYKARII